MPIDDKRRAEERAKQLADAKRALSKAVEDIVRRADPSPPPRRNGDPRDPRQEVAAEVTGIAQSKLSDVKNSKRIVRYDTLLLMADYLGVSVDSLLGRPLVMQEAEVVRFVRGLNVATARRLYDELRQWLDGSKLELATSATKPDLPPAVPNAAADRRPSDIGPSPATKRRRLGRKRA